MNDSIFDRILRREIPAQVVYENEHVLAFRDVSPQAPVHVLVIPKKKVESFSHYSAEPHREADLGRLMNGVYETVKALGIAGDGYRLVVNSGENGGQTVPYLHVHILAGRALTWPPG